MRRGTDSMEVIPCRGNKGGKMDENGRGRIENREEPGMVVSVQAGYLDQMT
jgi:hypothetical protein